MLSNVSMLDIILSVLGGSVRKKGCGCGGCSSSTGTAASGILQWPQDISGGAGDIEATQR